MTTSPSKKPKTPELDEEKPMTLEELERLMPWMFQGKGPPGHNI